MEEIQYLNKEIDFNNLIYHYKGNTAPKNFIGLKGQQDTRFLWKYKGSFYNTRKSRRITKII